MRKLFTCAVLLFFTITSFGQLELWGTTNQGGSIFAGTIFKLDTAGNNYDLRYEWTNVINGKRPLCAVTEFSNGKLYGVTLQNGAFGVGVLFEYDYTVDDFVKLHDFDVPTGSLPEGSVIEGSNGILYGLTGAGGSLNYGVLYQYDFGTNTYSVLQEFDLVPTGAAPHGAMVETPNGKFYGMNSHGGANGFGTIFEWDPGTSTFTNKLDLDSINNGYHPYGSLMLAPSGTMYALSYNGGVNNTGILFEYDPATNLTTKHADFTGLNGEYPYGNLIQASNGKLYGLTFEGGVNGQGTLFEFDMGTATLTKLVDFDAATTGAYPKGDLIQSANGKLYGYTSLGGAFSKGVIFEYDIATNAMAIKLNFDGVTGQYNSNSFIELCAKPIIDIAVSPNDTICSNELLTLTASGTNPTYTWNNTVVNGVPFNAASGTDYYVVSATNSCGTSVDSVLIVSYTGYNFSEEDTVCSGDSFTFPDATIINNITATVVHASNFTTALGCDSIITTTVYIDTVYNLSESDTVCSGGTYTFPDGFVLSNITGTTNHTSNLTTSKGCDSTINTGIFIYPVYSITQGVEVCSGGSVTYPDGVVETNILIPTSHVSSFVSINGCDSIITTNVSVNANYNLSDAAAVCSGDNYTFHDGFMMSNITSTVSHLSSLVSTKGCDSLITTTISVNPTYNVGEAFNVCPGSSFTFPDGFVLNNIQADAIHVSNLVGSLACDTIVTTELFVLPEYNIALSDTICKNESYTFDDGTVVSNITTTTVHTSAYSAINTCDSIITETVHIELIDNSVQSTDFTITSNQAGAAYQWVDCNDNYSEIIGETGQTFIPDSNGLYAVIITKGLCSDTSDCTVIDILSLDEHVDLESMVIYPNPANSEINLVFSGLVQNGKVSVFSMNGELVLEEAINYSNKGVIDISELVPGIYMVQVQSGTDFVTKRITKL